MAQHCVPSAAAGLVFVAQGRADTLATQAPVCGQRAFAPAPAPDGSANAVSRGCSPAFQWLIPDQRWQARRLRYKKQVGRLRYEKQVGRLRYKKQAGRLRYSAFRDRPLSQATSARLAIVLVACPAAPGPGGIIQTQSPAPALNWPRAYA